MEHSDFMFLKETGQKMNTQDYRSTAHPLFIIQSLKKQYRDKNWGYEKCERKEEQIFGDMCEECQLLSEKGEDIPDECENCDDDCFVYFNEEYEADLQAGFFFTEEACHEHIKLNGYHYHQPRSYVISAWRNPEMQKTMQIISALGADDKKPRDVYR